MSDVNPTSRRPNRLVDETSPYLLQHAHNPVDWYPWCDEALERAKEEDHLILLSIGYAACHWCHVMERESFEDEDIAAIMNEDFVNIKVDREERPDLDDIYMAATLAMNGGQGGWPMTVFLTPDQEPIFAGPYFPPTDAYGRPGFPTILKALARAWKNDRSKLRDQGHGVAEYLRRQGSQVGPAMEVGATELELALSRYSEQFDPVHGGFGPAPKFPAATSLALLLRLNDRFHNPSALTMVCKTLDAMANGGMYDQLGGGFARYSTDRAWLVPHFEKMLYDNALLANTYLEGYQAVGNTLYSRIATETLDFVLREMRCPEGGFYSSWDADSEGVEGKFYVWTRDEIRGMLDENRARRFCAYFDVTAVGNWEGRNILNVPQSLETVARELGVDSDDLALSIQEGRQQLYTARSRRVHPALDDKVLTSWNGLMISALSSGYRVLGVTKYLDAARNAADLILGSLSDDEGRLLRTWRQGKAHLRAYLEDYAYVSEGLVDLY
ncbi:MAG: thioredoxin domain-containing protein, partial [Gemmatimonadales bacterium]